MVESGDDNRSAYISTDQLAQMMAGEQASKLCILNTSCKPENEFDVFREHR